MGGQLGRTRIFEKRKRLNIASEKGYMLLTTLYFVLFSGLFAYSLIRISGNQIIQLNQITESYQARTALNMGIKLLEKELEDDDLPNKGTIYTSMGAITIDRIDTENEVKFVLYIQIDANSTYSEVYEYPLPEAENEPDEITEEDSSPI